MSEILKWIGAIIGVIVAFLLLGLVIYGIASILPPLPETTSSATQSNNPEAKPLTKVECDWLGFGGANIIEQQAAEGYRFTGKTTTLFCDNAMAFELINDRVTP